MTLADSIVRTMKRFGSAMGPALLTGLGVLLVTGCGGFSGSHSVSPASFFLPGLMHYESPRTPVTVPAPGSELMDPAEAVEPVSGPLEEPVAG